MRLLFLFLYILYRARMFCGDIHRLFTGKRQLTPSQQVRTISAQTHPSVGGSANGSGDDDSNGPSGGSPGASGLATVFGIDAARQNDQDNIDDGPFSNGDADLYPTHSVMGFLPKDVESALQVGPVSSVPQSPHRAGRSNTRMPTGRFGMLRPGSRSRSSGTDLLTVAPTFRDLHEQNISIGHRWGFSDWSIWCRISGVLDHSMPLW